MTGISRRRQRSQYLSWRSDSRPELCDKVLSVPMLPGGVVVRCRREPNHIGRHSPAGEKPREQEGN